MTASMSWELDREHEEFRASVRAFVDRQVRPVVEESTCSGWPANSWSMRSWSPPACVRSSSRASRRWRTGPADRTDDIITSARSDHSAGPIEGYLRGGCLWQTI